MACWTREYYSVDPKPWEYFLLPKCTDETKQEYKRIGLGCYLLDNGYTLFKDAQEQKVITLV
jgi:hypothetical protein